LEVPVVEDEEEGEDGGEEGEEVEGEMVESRW